MIYLDCNATSPLDPAVLERMLPFLTVESGNPSSLHAAGQRSRAAIDDAREQVAAALGCTPKEIVFTSGGTEANNLAVRGVFLASRPRRRVVTTCVEHPSVLDTALALAGDADVIELAVNRDGQLSLDEAERAITPDTALVSAMWANNETGVLFPVDRLAVICRGRGVPLHVDAVQAAGRISIDLRTMPIDLLTVSGHKFGGPKGTGALFVRKGTPLWSVQTGGHQERGRRGGTENVAGIVGLGAAIDLAVNRLSEQVAVGALRDRLERAIVESVPHVEVLGVRSPRVANTLNVCFRDVEGEALLMALDLAGICASSGSACTAGSLDPSHVVRALGLGPKLVRGAIRFSLGRTNTAAEIEEVARLTPQIVSRLRARGN